MLTAVPVHAEVRLAVEQLLRALRVSVESDPELRETPERVARMFTDELLDGYQKDPAKILAESGHTESNGIVLLTDLRFTLMCPHHLLPAVARAHVGYIPSGKITGLGAILKLIECFAHRLVLQETLAQQIVDALCTHLGARGAGVIIRAQHACLSARGENQRDASLVTTAFAGSMQTAHSEARAMFYRSISGTPSIAEP
jgi:GTP cyclohydrolase I